MFVKVNVAAGSAAGELGQELGIESLPTFALFSGSHGLVSRFGLTLSQPSLDRFRLQLRTHSTPRSSLEPSQAGMASVFDADGWPVPVAICWQEGDAAYWEAAPAAWGGGAPPPHAVAR